MVDDFSEKGRPSGYINVYLRDNTIHIGGYKFVITVRCMMEEDDAILDDDNNDHGCDIGCDGVCANYKGDNDDDKA